MLWVRELFINSMLSLEPPHSHVWNNPLKGHKKTRSEGPSEQTSANYFLILNIGLSLQSTAVLNLFYPILKVMGSFSFFHSPNIHTLFVPNTFVSGQINQCISVYFLYSFNFSPHKVKFSEEK